MTNQLKDMDIKIISAYIEITSKCNLRCKHCYNSSGNNNEMPFEKFKEIVLELKKLGVNFISLSGGEPLLHSRFWELLDFLDSENIFFLIITNGCLWTDNIIQKIKKYSCNIQLSLDGGSEQTHDFIRGTGMFNLAINNMEKLIESGFKGNIVIKGVVTKKLTEDEILSYLEIAKRIKAVKVEFGWLNKSGRAIDNFDDLYIGTEQIQFYIDMLEKYKVKNEKFEFSGLGYTNKCPLEYIENNQLNLSIKIDYNGNLYTCQMFVDPMYSLGNIYTSSVINCIYSQKFSNLLKLLSVRKEYMKKCFSCVFKVKCYRGCPAISIQKSDIFTEDEYCSLRKKEARIKIFNGK